MSRNSARCQPDRPRSRTSIAEGAAPAAVGSRRPAGTTNRSPAIVGVTVLLTLFPLWPGSASAQFDLEWQQPVDPGQLRPGKVEIRTAWSQTAAHPGDLPGLAVVIDVNPGWHINADEAQIVSAGGFTPIATTLTVAHADLGLAAGPIQFPPAHDLKTEFTDTPLKVFEKQVVLRLPITVAADVAPGSVKLEMELQYQACNDSICDMKRTIRVPVVLEIVGPDREVRPANGDLFAGFDPINPSTSTGAFSRIDFAFFGTNFPINATTIWGFLLALLLTALGGLLLNFTPCVLPVIPIKIMGLSQAAGSRGRCLALGLSMSIGVVGFWVGLGGAIAAVGGFTSTNQLFQYPAFTLTVGAVIAVMALGMCGLFFIRLPRFVYALQPRHHTLSGSIGFGIMTAILSTPCTAPFMGAAAAWATTQPPAITLLIFAAIGAGMALPYLLLSAFPALIDRMPRTGPASELIKQVMGLFMLAAAAYFVGVGVVSMLKAPAEPPSSLYWWPVVAIIAAAGLWLALRTFKVTKELGRRSVWAGAGALLIAASIFAGTRLTDDGPIDWVYYTPERFARQLREGRVVVMDFTAEWCLNCKAIEYTVLHSEPVVRAMAQDDVVAMKVDITSRRDEDGYQMLSEVGRVTIPLLVVFAPDRSEVFKSHAYTVQEVLDAVAEARKKSGPVAIRSR